MLISKSYLKQIIIEELDKAKQEKTINSKYTAKISLINFLKLTLTKDQFLIINNFLKQINDSRNLEDIKQKFKNFFDIDKSDYEVSGKKAYPNLGYELIDRAIKNFDTYYNPNSDKYASNKDSSNYENEKDIYLTIMTDPYPHVVEHQGRGRLLRNLFNNILNNIKSPEKKLVQINIRISSNSYNSLDSYYEKSDANLGGQGIFKEISFIPLNKALIDLKKVN